MGVVSEARPERSVMDIDLLLHHGAIRTMDPTLPRAEAVAVAGNRIAAVGGSDELLPLASPATQVIDLQGQLALPAFTDCHIHFLSYALRLAQIDVSRMASKGDILERVAKTAAATPPGRWVQGGGWDRNLWPRSSFPNRQDLDRVASRVPVALSSKCGHALWVNSQALELAGVRADTPDVAGGEILRDAATGEPTGILTERAAELVQRVVPAPSPQEAEDAILGAVPGLHRVGVTGIHDCEGADAFRAFQRLAARDQLDVRVLMHIPQDGLESALTLGLRSGLGDDLIRVGSVKLFADGSLGARTAGMLEPYEDEPDNLGIMLQSEQEIKSLVRQICRGSLAPAIHAIGDRATHAVLDAYEGCRPLWAAQGLRPRMEHAQLLRSEDIARLAKSGVIASMQPIHCTADMEMVDLHWGLRGVGAYAFSSLLAAGAHLAFGSDAPVEDMRPLAGIHAAVTRRRADGSPGLDGWRPSERLTVAQAVRAYTMGAAYASAEERSKGSITAGKIADVIVLSQDIFAIDPMEIRETEVVATIFNGRRVW